MSPQHQYRPRALRLAPSRAHSACCPLVVWRKALMTARALPDEHGNGTLWLGLVGSTSRRREHPISLHFQHAVRWTKFFQQRPTKGACAWWHCHSCGASDRQRTNFRVVSVSCCHVPRRMSPGATHKRRNPTQAWQANLDKCAPRPHPPTREQAPQVKASAVFGGGAPRRRGPPRV